MRYLQGNKKVIVQCNNAVNGNPRVRVSGSSSLTVQLNQTDKVNVLPFGQLVENETVFSELHRVRAVEVQPDQRASVVTVANLLQEVAGNHVVALVGRTNAGFAVDPDMLSENLIFVVSRLDIQMADYPVWGDVLLLETWYEVQSKLLMRRDWTIVDAKTRKQLGAVTSTWVTMNTETRRLCRIPDYLQQKWQLHHSERRAIPLSENGSSNSRLPQLGDNGVIHGPKQVARRSDMDMNGHINTSSYLAWALETVPQNIYDSCQLSRIEVEYKAECVAGDEIESLACPLTENHEGGTYEFIHVVRRCQGDKCVELVRARSIWKIRSE
eukprot:TRINITY_DN7700_c0_g1_i1.p1 TRINITY_DN7700_c0_g1~~TRINITY_DN7700_c0_g1_i1.p1  ORF type:complete len:326 (-),score=23.59 TRINITY_DN7700_c0_g1_i1:350-1327(-)